jgi:hypothetical protein
MSNVLVLNKPQVLSGLGTMTYVIAADGLYSVRVVSTEVPPSGVTIVVKQNGATKYTAPVLAQTQGSIQFKFSPLVCVATDVIDVILSSAQAIDSQINNVKSSISIEQGA